MAAKKKSPKKPTSKPVARGAAVETPAPTPPAPSSMLVPGTVLQKRDRAGAVRCECTVEADGFRFEGKLYSSISAAAGAAAEALGLNGKSVNGYVFWGLAKPNGREMAQRLDGLFRRYSNAAMALLKADGEEKAAGVERIRQHLAQLQAVL